MNIPLVPGDPTFMLTEEDRMKTLRRGAISLVLRNHQGFLNYSLHVGGGQDHPEKNFATLTVSNLVIMREESDARREFVIIEFDGLAAINTRRVLRTDPRGARVEATFIDSLLAITPLGTTLRWTTHAPHAPLCIPTLWCIARSAARAPRMIVDQGRLHLQDTIPRLWLEGSPVLVGIDDIWPWVAGVM